MKTHTRITLAIVLAAAPAALGGSTETAPTPSYSLHEWGTFTTVSGSDGVLLPGLQREEEALPDFVESHEGMMNSLSPMAMKGWLRPLENVFVKMETPVIYFYTKQPFHARVKVAFHGGSISQWFPPRSGGETPPPVKRDKRNWPLDRENTIDFDKGYEGGIEWDVDVAPPGPDASGLVFKGGETINWLLPRQPDSAVLTTKNGEMEKFLFYRGVGSFTLPVVVSMSDERTLCIENRGTEAVPSLFVFDHSNGAGAQFASLPALEAGKTTIFQLDKQKTRIPWHRGVYDEMIKQLTAAGLNRAEADAMLQTWWKSYFEHAGLRVFWVVPRAFTDRELPLSVNPAPYDSVRVLVGRSEVLKPEFEKDLAVAFVNEERNPYTSDRFFLAYQARVDHINGKSAGNSTPPATPPTPIGKTARK